MRSWMEMKGWIWPNFLLLRALALLMTAFLLASPNENTVQSLSVDEVCQNCQRVLYFAYQHYRTQTTKRFLRHKLKHLCNRYYDYRRHCITTLLPKVDMIWSDMDRTLTIVAGSPEDRRYKPIKTCEQLKECDKGQSPIEFGTHPPTLPPIPAGTFANDSDTTRLEMLGGGNGAGGFSALETPDYVF